MKAPRHSIHMPKPEHGIMTWLVSMVTGMSGMNGPLRWCSFCNGVQSPDNKM